MFDSVPPQAWLLVLIALCGYGPARYVVEHITHSPERRDITAPPEDFAWRTTGQLVRYGTILAVLAALAVFIFTPTAEAFAQSDYFPPTIMGAVCLGTAYTVVEGFISGRVLPLVKGASGRYERATQPKRFWASMAWNGVLAGGSLALAVSLLWKGNEDYCHDLGSAETAQDKLTACNVLLSEARSDAERGEILASRGIAHYWLGEHSEAIADYTQALAEYPRDDATHYNRALVYERTGDWRRALADYDAAVKLHPDYFDAYLNRGLLHLNTGQPDRAIADLTRAHELDPDNAEPLANRGIVSALTGDAAAARADFARVDAIEPSNLLVLHGWAILAIEAEDLPGAVARLTEALRIDPEDAWALRTRADVYWRMGLHAEAQDDDDKFNALRDRREGRR